MHLTSSLIVTGVVIYAYLFFFDQPTGQTLGRIFARDSSKDAKSRKDVPFWVIKLKFNFKHLFIPQNRQIGVGDSKYDIFDYKFWSLDPISPKFPNFATQMLLFRLKHTVAVVTHANDAHVLQIFYTTWVRGVACQKRHLRPNLEGVWARGTSKKIWDPYLFLQPLKLATSNLVCNLGLGLDYQKTTFRTKIGGGLGQGSIRKNGTPYLFLQPTEKLVHNRFTLPNTSFRTKLGIWIRSLPVLPSPLWWWCNCVFYVPSKTDG